MSRRGYSLKIKLVELVRAQYALRQRTLKVMTADPKTEMELPCIGVNRSYDSEDDESFANFFENEIDPATMGNVVVSSALFTATCELRVWSLNADERDSMYEDLKEILVLIKPQLAALGFGSIKIKGGRDENDFRTYSPLMMYWGAINVSALSPMDAWNAAPDTTATPIQSLPTTINGESEPSAP